MTYDILIRGGTSFDGSSSPGIAGDLALENGRIAAIGNVSGTAKKTIDADRPRRRAWLHRHQDAFRLHAADQPQGREQGAPGRHHRDHRPLRLLGRAGAARQGRAAQGLSQPERAVAAVSKKCPFRNISTRSRRRRSTPACWSATTRCGLMVMGMADRAPSPAELDAMIALLEDGLKAGALGMSSGLFTSPGSYARPDEMIAFGHVLKRYNAGYFTHLRDEFEQGDRRAGGGDRRRQAMRRPCRDRALQVLRHGQLGQGRDRAEDDRRRPRARPRRRLRFLPLRRRHRTR